MKGTRFGLSLLLLVFALALLQGCSTVLEKIVGEPGRPADRESTEESATAEERTPLAGGSSAQSIVGIWTNPAYNTDARSARLEYSPQGDGVFKYVATDTDSGGGKRYEGTVTYKERWMDSEGRICGKSDVDLSAGMTWETLDRISADGNTLEVQSSTREIDPQGARYSVYYRR